MEKISDKKIRLFGNAAVVTFTDGEGGSGARRTIYSNGATAAACGRQKLKSQRISRSLFPALVDASTTMRHPASKIRAA